MSSQETPVVVTTIQRGTGDGSVPLPPQTLAITRDGFPNVLINTLTPLRSVLIRSSRVGIQTFLATSGLGGTGTLLNISMLQHIHIREIVVISLATAGVCALQNIAELLGNLDQKFPMLRG